MSVTSLRQNRQFYVANKLITGATALANKGEIKVKSIGDIEKEVYFEVLGPDTVLKSDYIQVKNITAAKAIKAVDMETPMKKVLVTLDSSVNGGTPVVGQDYILRINLRQFYGMSDQDQYFKDAAVRAVKGMTAKQFYEAMEKALNLCFSREVGANAKSNPYLTFSSSAAGLVIEEKPQSWHLGTEAQERVYFDVVPTTIYCDGADLIWGSVAEQTPATKIGNGKKIADLEYFLLGERGDQYRKIGWPNDVETVGMVDPDKTYDVFEIHYAFTDTGVNSYRSEKDITIAVPTAVKSTDDGGADYTVINAIISAFNTATGLNVATLK
nr:MAG TPA: Structural protein [Crassvirales sp.]